MKKLLSFGFIFILFVVATLITVNSISADVVTSIPVSDNIHQIQIIDSDKCLDNLIVSGFTGAGGFSGGTGGVAGGFSGGGVDLKVASYN